MISFEQKTSTDIVIEVARRVKEYRKARGFTQAQLAERAGVSLPSYKRFEQKGLISFQSLAAIALALGCEADFGGLFAHRAYRSIDEVVAAAKRGRAPFSGV